MNGVSLAFCEGIISNYLGGTGAKNAVGIIEKQGQVEAKRLQESVIAAIKAHIPSFDDSGLGIGNAYQKGDGEIVIPLYFEPKALHRDSLCPKKYPEGAYDIVGLFERGWTASKRVRGTWHGKTVWSRQSREATGMLAGAVAAYNASAPEGVRAELRHPYK